MGWMWGVRVKKEHRRTGAAGSIAMLLMKWGRLGEGQACGKTGGQRCTGKVQGACGCVSLMLRGEGWAGARDGESSAFGATCLGNG